MIDDLTQKIIGAKCRTENSADTRLCRSCGHDLAGISSFARAFSNLTTVLFIAVFLLVIFLLCFPRINSHPRPAILVRQKAYFHTLDAALSLFDNEFDGYPPSDALDPTGRPYCGAMKLCEAMMGQDLMGFHPDSLFRSDSGGLYTKATVKDRKGALLPLENANAYTLADIYGADNTSSFPKDAYVLCDVFKQVTHKSTKKRIGMPILYYKANTSHTEHDVNNPDNTENIYNYKDNYALLELGVPWDRTKKHPLFTNPELFYEMITNTKVTTKSIPHRADSYILISAGWDGLYGTPDDICNFAWRFKRKSEGEKK